MRGVPLLAYALAHPALHRPEDERAGATLQQAKEMLPTAEFQAAHKVGVKWFSEQVSIEEIMLFLENPD